MQTDVEYMGTTGTDAVTDAIKVAYDAIDYDCTAYPQSHPDRLRTVAQMFGVDAPPVATARVLETTSNCARRTCASCPHRSATSTT